jgi:hypothetical protein
MRKWLIGSGVLVLLLAGGAFFAYRQAKELSTQWEPMARQQLIEYLEKRFDSSVEVGKLDFQVPALSPWEVWRQGVKGRILKVWGENFKLRWKRRTDIPPMIEFRRVTFDVDLGSLYEGPKIIQLVTLEGLRITMPPKGQRPTAGSKKPDQDKTIADVKKPDVDPALQPGAEPQRQGLGVVVQKIVADGAFFQILPRNPKKLPLEFDLYKLTLTSQGEGKPLAFTTEMTNPKPPGLIISSGYFGPWNKEDPRRSAVEGVYKFEKADLGVFKGIAGILDSTGKYSGVIEEINAEGECRVPDFRLTLSGNPVPLKVKYTALVDGTDGDTYLRPVQATLGKTPLTAQGEVVHIEGRKGRSIRLDVTMNNGHIEDVLRLAMKGQNNFLDGRINLKTKLDLPPGDVPVEKKLNFAGEFTIDEANFTSSAVQDKIDTLSRKGQGKPKDPTIENVPAKFRGAFRMANGKIDFDPVTFNVPGAMVRLNGFYETEGAVIDLRGSLRLEAKVSETFGGWKKFVLKPIDPLFSKNGAGTFLRIAVTGTKDDVKFGLDRGNKDNEK